MLICFARPTGFYDLLLNKVVAFLTGGSFCHVIVLFELQREDGNYDVVECSIVRSDDDTLNRVHFDEELQDMSDWSCFRLNDTRPEFERQIYENVKREMTGIVYQNGLIFEDIEFSNCFGRRKYVKLPSQEKTYCSKLTMNILQRMGRFDDVNCMYMSPNGLYRVIRDQMRHGSKEWTEIDDVNRYAKIVSEKIIRDTHVIL
jgi:hypothetical protein